jgi:hypothetical protein
MRRRDIERVWRSCGRGFWRGRRRKGGRGGGVGGGVVRRRGRGEGERGVDGLYYTFIAAGVLCGGGWERDCELEVKEGLTSWMDG